MPLLSCMQLWFMNISGSFDQTVQSIFLITVTVAASSVDFVFVIGNPKFVRNLKLRAASPATRKPSE